MDKRLIEQIKKKLNKISFDKFIKTEHNYYDDMLALQNDLNDDNIIDYINMFSKTPVHRLFIALTIQHKVNINNIRNQISLDIYLTLYCWNNYTNWPPVPQQHINCIQNLLQQINIEHLSLVHNLVYNSYIPKSCHNVLIDRILALCFNDNEVKLINQYWQNRSLVWFESKDLTKTNLRKLIIAEMFAKLSNTKREVILILKNSFTNELIYIDNFIYVCCQYNILDKDFIKNVYLNNSNSFHIIIDNSEQHQDYINSLEVLDTLQGKNMVYDK